MYYYLLSSLPYLSETTEYFPSLDDFVAACKEQLCPAHFAILEKADTASFEDINTGSDFLLDYFRMEKALRNEVAHERSRKTGFGYEAYDADGVSWYRERIIQAVSAHSPLAGENMLFSIRFELVSQREAGRYFTFDNVLAYYLKLQFLHRKKNMNRKQGQEAFDSAYTTISAPLEDGDGLSVGV